MPLSVDVDSFIHEIHPTASFPSQTLSIRGGNLDDFINFTGGEAIYLYGSSSTYVGADNDNISKITNDVAFKCDIPIAQLTGNYSSRMYYKLNTQSNNLYF